MSQNCNCNKNPYETAPSKNPFINLAIYFGGAGLFATGLFWVTNKISESKCTDDFIEQRNATECVAQEISAFIIENDLNKKDLFSDKNIIAIYDELDDIGDNYKDHDFKLAHFIDNQDTVLLISGLSKNNAVPSMAFVPTP